MPVFSNAIRVDWLEAKTRFNCSQLATMNIMQTAVILTKRSSLGRILATVGIAGGVWWGKRPFISSFCVNMMFL